MDELIYLVTASRRGDAEAFRGLVRRFQNMAYGYACAILGDIHLAEDATQDAFIEAYDRMPSLVHPLAFPGWLRQLVFKHCDRQTRGKRLIATVHTLPEAVSLQWDPARIEERRDLAQHVLRAIQTLPEHQREITTLFYLKGCSQQDIAAFLNVPVGTITTRLQRARKKLRQRMLECAEEALRQNYLDDRFATHLVASLMGRRKLLVVDGHPVRLVWEEVRDVLRDFEVVEGDEIEDAEVMKSLDGDNFHSAFRITEGDVLRTHMLATIWRSLRGRTPPARLLTAGRAFRNCAEGDRHNRVFHQIEGVCVDEEVDERSLRATVDKILTSLLETDDIRWQPVSSKTLENAFTIAVKKDCGVLTVGSAGVLGRNVMRELGMDSVAEPGFVFGFGAERLAMLKFGIQDIRDLWGPKYCPVVDNFDQCDLQQVLHREEHATGPAVKTNISGVVHGLGRIKAPGQTWLSPDDVLHIRGLTYSNDKHEGDLEGEETVELNLDLDQRTGNGLIRNQAMLEVAWPERGLSGTFSGKFTAKIENGAFCGIAKFHGSRGFEGMKAVVQTRCDNLPGDGDVPTYEGVIIEPPHK